MIVKKVNRYYCEFCKKSGCSGGHISKHEKSCTRNPNRICRLCELLKRDAILFSDLLAAIPAKELFLLSHEFLDKNKCDDAPYIFKDGIDQGSWTAATVEAIRKLSNCPVCIMAVLKQSGAYVYSAKDFDFKKECEEQLREYNEDEAEQYSYRKAYYHS